ncbi:hypothetical protein [uncultured Bacteroides sp.]|uniref:hypothetical protein n=1 Tax=uncultured Bacteroides sp. TaxID=162156 RepID=UPI002AABBC6F|nr:hypothetical protein [uncultured Bacteroides sp.]
MIKQFFIFLFVFYVTPSLGSNIIRLKVTGESSAPLSYCDVFVNNKWHLLTDDVGSVTFKSSLCEVGDTLQISYLGYEHFHLVISSRFLNTTEHVVQLLPKSYNLDDIVVKGTFDAEKFFKKKKKSMLMPYSDKHLTSVFAKISYVDSVGRLHNYSGNFKILFKLQKLQIIENECIPDSVMQVRIKRSLQLATYIPFGVCLQKFRKLHDVQYLGIRDNKWCFMFNVKPKFISHPFFSFQKEDKSPTQVNLDKSGFISSMQTHTIIESESANSHSYNLYTEYIPYKSFMAPSYINITLINEKMNIELKCSYE